MIRLLDELFFSKSFRTKLLSISCLVAFLSLINLVVSEDLLLEHVIFIKVEIVEKNTLIHVS